MIISDDEARSTVFYHKGFMGSTAYSAEDDVYHGRIENITDLVTFEADDAISLGEAFIYAVDDYLKWLENGKPVA